MDQLTGSSGYWAELPAAQRTGLLGTAEAADGAEGLTSFAAGDLTGSTAGFFAGALGVTAAGAAVLTAWAGAGLREAAGLRD